MAFHDTRLNVKVELGALYGPRGSTTVWEAASGYEKRNRNWADMKCEGDVGYGLLTEWVEDDFPIIEEIVSFFRARDGRAHTFRFKDWSDYQIGDQDDPLATRQAIGEGDDSATAFQVFKRYTSGSTTKDRDVHLLVSGTLFVYVGGTLQTEGVDYTANYLTGVVTFTSAPTYPEEVAVTVEFDNHVRFDTDHLQISMDHARVGSAPNIPIVEVRELPEA